MNKKFKLRIINENDKDRTFWIMIHERRRFKKKIKLKGILFFHFAIFFFLSTSFFYVRLPSF